MGKFFIKKRPGHCPSYYFKKFENFVKIRGTIERGGKDTEKYGYTK